MKRADMTMVSGAAKAVPGDFFWKKTTCCVGKGGFVSVRVGKAIQRRVVSSDVRRKEVTV